MKLNGSIRFNRARLRDIARPRGGFRRVALALSAFVLVASLAKATSRDVLRIGTSGDYAPFSWLASDATGDPRQFAEQLGGFDIDIGRAYATDRELDVEWVRFRWPNLIRDLEAGRFDVAMGGITIRVDRAIAGRFSVPVMQSGAVALVSPAVRANDVRDLNEPTLRIAVNAGGHLERVARRYFPRAQVNAIPDNAAITQQLLRGDADAVITDTLEAPKWKSELSLVTELGPFTRDLKAYLTRADRPLLAADLDRWLVQRESDGTLAELRSRHFAGSEPLTTADPLFGVLAAVSVRLSLMPFVADAKGRNGSPIEVPEREILVLNRAVATLEDAAVNAGTKPPDEAAVRSFYRAQIEAAKAIQRAVLSGASSAAPPRRHASLEDELRPALLRIGEQLARLIIRLPGTTTPEQARQLTLRELGQGVLRDWDIEPIHADAIAAALASLCSPPE